MTGFQHSWGREIPCPACGDLDGCRHWRDEPPRVEHSDRIPAQAVTPTQTPEEKTNT